MDGKGTVPGRGQPPTEREKTAAEEYFSRPLPSVGEALGAERPERERLDEKELERKERKEADYVLLLTAGEQLPLMRRVQLYRLLDEKQQRRYLLQLPLAERRTFLRAIGRDELWFAEDLRAAELDLELRQFGLDFFAAGPEGVAPDQSALVGPDYVIGPGDALVITTWGNIEGQSRVTVGRNGEIVIPKVGTVTVWGQTFAEAKETIRGQIQRLYRNFEMSVSLGAIRSIQVFVVGEVQTPGSYTVSSLSTVLTTLAAAGGPTGTGSLRQLQLRRGGETVATVDLYDFFLRGDKSRDLRLQAGDTLFVPVVGPLVGVAGDVRRPAIYELLGGETLPEILAMAGGATATALPTVQVERIDPVARKKVVLDVDLSAGDPAGFTMRDRDLVKVLPIAGLSGSYVRLAGHVARPGAYQLTPGMRISDLVAQPDTLLPGYFPGFVEILRLQPPTYRPGRLTVDLHRALEGDPQHDIVLQEYDEVRIFSRRQMEEIPEIHVSGSVLNPGTFRLYDDMTVRDLVVAAGNVRRHTYLAEAELTRFSPEGRQTRTERRLIDLGKALAGDPAHDLALHPDDHLFVRAIPDAAERKVVEIRGEVLFPGSYAIARGETLSSVLKRAGGFTTEAYQRGAVFTRESLKQSQQQRLNQLIFEQEQEILRISTQMAQGAISAEEMTAAQEIVANRSAMLEKLKQTPALGRMVVRLPEVAKAPGGEHDIELMDGDLLTVPKNPQSVTVLGQVYNPVSLAYRPGKTVGHYLSEVGGPKRDANTKEMFVVRADGTVISASQSGLGLRWDSDSHRWTTGGFNSTILQPGDALLVPEKVQKTAWLREIRDISTIVFQLALGAAAIASF